MESTVNPKRRYSSPQLIRRFSPYFSKYKHMIAFDLFCAALTTLCDIILPVIMRRITNSALGTASPLTAELVLKLAALYVVLRLIDAAASFWMATYGHIMGVYIETDMRKDAFSHLLKLSDTYYANTKIGQIMGRITNDLFDVTEFSHHCPEEFFIAFVKFTASFAILCTASVPLTLIVFACIPLMAVVSTILNHKLRAAFKEQRYRIGELNARIEDSLLGQKVVKAFTAEEKELEKFRNELKKGDKVVTAGGIYGTIAEIDDKTVMIRVDGDTKLRVAKSSLVRDYSDSQQ